MESRTRECNNYFTEKQIIVYMKLSDIQEKGGWSLNMITCLESSFTYSLILQSRLQRCKLSMLQSRLRVSIRISMQQSRLLRITLLRSGLPGTANYDAAT